MEKKNDLVFPWKVGNMLEVVKFTEWDCAVCVDSPIGIVRKGDVITVTKIGESDYLSTPFAATFNGKEYGFSYNPSNEYKLAEPDVKNQPKSQLKFKVGDKVRITKPEYDSSKPVWSSPGMDSLNGLEIEVTDRIISYDSKTISVSNEHGLWTIKHDWCTFIEEEPRTERVIEHQPKHRIYIAGRITGLCPGNVDRAFGKAKELIEQWGFEPVSPLDHGDESKSWVENMLILLPILNTCDGIYLLDNWEESDGAKIEKKFAEKKGMFLIREVVR